MRSLALGAVLVGVLTPGAARAQSSYDLTWDTFSGGLTVGTASAKWFHFGSGGFTGDNGTTQVLSNGLYVRALGVNAQTNLPAFSLTMGREESNGGYPGAFDHVKWLVYMNHMASTGFAGFDAVYGQELACSTRMIGQTFGTRFHPFGSKASATDVRLASFAMNAIDLESYMVFDFMFTNKRIYAIYERLPFGRTQTNRYAAFTYAIPVASRSTGSAHDVKIAYDRSAGIVRWLLNGKEVFRVDQLGRRLGSRRYMVIDHGGVEQTVNMRQLNCGMGMFTLLDASGGSQPGLVRLSSSQAFYYAPSKGEPNPQTFVDETSQFGSRLFGQGAEFSVGAYRVSSTTAGVPAPVPEPIPVEDSPSDPMDGVDGQPNMSPIPEP